jgi:hypothetical protein
MKENLVIQKVFNKGGSALLSFSLQNFPESLATLTALLIKVKAAVQHAECLVGIVNQRQFFAKSGMAPQFPSNENPISLLALAQSSGRADPDTPAAGQASRSIEERSPILYHDGVFLAGVLASAAFGARLLRDLRDAGSNESHVHDLRPRTGIGAIGDGDTEFMVHFQRALNALLEKILELSAGEGFSQCRGERLANDRTIGAAARSEAGFHLIALDLILHVFEKAPLAGAHMLHSHFLRATTADLFFNALFDALPHEKGNAGDGLLCFVSPIHNTAPP